MVQGGKFERKSKKGINICPGKTKAIKGNFDGEKFNLRR
jgi:hypothetical protein